MTDDPFDILALPATFHLTPAEIRKAYLAQATAHHPDAAGPAGPADPDEARAARINAAKLTLQDPEARAEALLRRLGGPSKDQDRTLPEGFLAAMLEARERADEARSAGDAPGVRAFLDAASDARDRHIREAGRLFDDLTGCSGAPRGERLAAVRRELNAWRYIERMIEQLEAEAQP